MLFFTPRTTERNSLSCSEYIYEPVLCLSFVYFKTGMHSDMDRGMSAISASASESDNKLTAVTLSRSPYLSFVLKLNQHDVFSPVCLCVEFHQATEEWG